MFLTTDVPEMDNSILLSGATDTDEGLDMSQEASPAVEGAGSLWSVSSRLQKAVEKLIFTLTETQIQVQQSHRDETLTLPTIHKKLFQLVSSGYRTIV